MAKLVVFFTLVFIGANISYAFQTNSSNYNNFPLIVSNGGEITNSESYKHYTATGIIAGVIKSETYKNLLGFFHAWLLADGQPCTSTSQCAGGFCCSSVCGSSPCPSRGGGGGGTGDGEGAAGGAGAITLPTIQIIRDFDISPESIKIKLALGEIDERSITIKNKGNIPLIVSLILEGVRKYASLSKDRVELLGEKSESVALSFLGREVGAFTGEIIASDGAIERSVPLIIEVISKLVLFDVKLDIPLQYSEVEAGDKLEAQITLLNVGAPEKVDVFATYFIKDLRGNIVNEESETFAVEKQLSYKKSFDVHKSSLPGSYVAIVEIRYADSFAVSSQLFRVVEEKKKVIVEVIKRNAVMTLFSIIIIIGVISILLIKLISISKRGRKRNKKFSKKNED